MDTTQIIKILSANPQTRNIFRGCFPSDRLPDPASLVYPAALVVNLEPHHMEGSHWVALYAQNLNREIYYFDSLNLPTSNAIMVNFLQKFPLLRRNVKAYQSPFSSNCAHFCILFIYYISQGYTFDQVLNLFEKNFNDNFVKIMVNKLVE